jgi:hypothetical protein
MIRAPRVHPDQSRRTDAADAAQTRADDARRRAREAREAARRATTEYARGAHERVADMHSEIALSHEGRARALRRAGGPRGTLNRALPRSDSAP